MPRRRRLAVHHRRSTPPLATDTRVRRAAILSPAPRYERRTWLRIEDGEARQNLSGKDLVHISSTMG